MTGPAAPSSKTIKRLFAHSGNRCAFPKCADPVIEGETVVGEICHIRAARPEGPRYDELQTPEQRHAFENLILLCSKHHKVIDDDPEAYSVARLKKMKTDHERGAAAISDKESEGAAQLLLSINQSGGIAAQTINAQNIHVHGPQITPVSLAWVEPPPLTPASLFFSLNEAIANAGYPGEQEFFFPVERALYMRFFPTQVSRVTLAKLTEVFNRRSPFPLSDTTGGLSCRNRYGAIVIDPVGTDVHALTQAFDTGEMVGLNKYVFRPWVRNVGMREVPILALPMQYVEQIFVRCLKNFTEIGVREFGLTPPFSVQLGGFGLDDVYLTVPGGAFNNGQAVGPVLQGIFRRTYALDDVSQGTLDSVLKSFFDDFYDLAACNRSAVLTDAYVTAHRMAPR